MRHINKSSEPVGLTKFKKSKPQKWEEIHTPSHQPIYIECKRQCLADQQQLSGYSEVPLTEKLAHIDHYILRDFNSDYTFEWQNMVADAIDNRFGA